MQENINQYFSLLLTTVVFLVGLAALVGGIQKKENPFFWIKKNENSYLKTSLHYILFGIVSISASLYYAYRTLHSLGII